MREGFLPLDGMTLPNWRERLKLAWAALRGWPVMSLHAFRWSDEHGWQHAGHIERGRPPVEVPALCILLVGGTVAGSSLDDQPRTGTSASVIARSQRLACSLAVFMWVLLCIEHG